MSKLLNGRRFGIGVFRSIERLAITGASRTYDSDNPIRVVEIERGLGRLCALVGLGVVETDTWALGLGRESLCELARNAGGLDVAAAERAFTAEWRGHRSTEYQHKLDQARRRLVPEQKLRHELVNAFPKFRVWPKDPDHVRGGPDKVQLRLEVDGLCLHGIFLGDRCFSC